MGKSPELFRKLKKHLKAKFSFDIFEDSEAKQK
jgi:hypothetical protein